MSGYREQVEVTCAECGKTMYAVMLHELGGHFLIGAAEDGCPVCGGRWDDAKTTPIGD